MKTFVKVLKYFFLFLILLIGVGIFKFWKNDIPIEELKAKYTNEESEFVKIQGMDVHFRIEGIESDTLPIVLLHGTGASLHTWEAWVKELKKTHKVITLDLPAYGLTGAIPTGDYSLKSYAMFLDEFLVSQKVNKCVLGGNSLGGAIAWSYAVDFPAKVNKLILIDAGGPKLVSKSVPIAFQIAKIPVLKNLFKYVTPRSIVEGSVRNVYGNPNLVSETLIDRYFELSLREGNRKAFIERISDIKKLENRFNEVANLKMPILLMWGKKDLLIPIEVEKIFEKTLTTEQVVIYDDLGHVPMEENPEKTVIDALKFINQK
jgi:pimeloyl-ACP methyl ester carboxylesterase